MSNDETQAPEFHSQGQRAAYVAALHAENEMLARRPDSPGKDARAAAVAAELARFGEEPAADGDAETAVHETTSGRRRPARQG